MVLFLQLDLPNDLGLGYGNHLSIFMSPKVNEIPSFDHVPSETRLSENFWEKREQHFKAYSFKGNGETQGDIDSYLAYQAIEISEAFDELDIKVGGEPDWLQDPEIVYGPKGEEFKFVLQIPNGYGFPKRDDAAEQIDSFSTTDYCLFLGNQIYVFISAEINHPEAVWIVVQN